MGSFSHGIADAIRRMGDAQAQGALQKGAVYGNLAHELGQAPMQYLAIDRGLHENKYRQTMQAAQEKKIKDDQEFEALINSTPPGPERLKVSLEFWQGRDPEKYDAIIRGAHQASSQALAAQQGRPGIPTMTPDPVSGEPTQLDNQTHHDPIHFAGGYGVAPYDVTADTDTQAAQKTSLQKYMDSLQQEAGRRAGGAGTEEANRIATTISEGEKNRENQRTLEEMRGQRPDRNTSNTELFMQDPKAYAEMLKLQESIQAQYRKDPTSKNKFQILYEDDGLPHVYWVNEDKKTIERTDIKGARTEPRDIAGASQAILQSVDVSLPVLKELETDLKVLDSGPLKGRLAQFSLSNLGGAGLGQKEVAIRTKLGRLTADQIFGEGGKQLTGTEKAMIEPFVLNQEDTLQTALAKLPELRVRLQRIKQSRVSMMNPRTRAVHSDLTGDTPQAPTGGVQGLSTDEILKRLAQ